MSYGQDLYVRSRIVEIEPIVKEMYERHSDLTENEIGYLLDLEVELVELIDYELRVKKQVYELSGIDWQEYMNHG